MAVEFEFEGATRSFYEKHSTDRLAVGIPLVGERFRPVPATGITGLDRARDRIRRGRRGDFDRRLRGRGAGNGLDRDRPRDRDRAGAPFEHEDQALDRLAGVGGGEDILGRAPARAAGAGDRGRVAKPLEVAIFLFHSLLRPLCAAELVPNPRRLRADPLGARVVEARVEANARLEGDGGAVFASPPVGSLLLGTHGGVELGFFFKAVAGWQGQHVGARAARFAIVECRGPFRRRFGLQLGRRAEDHVGAAGADVTGVRCEVGPEAALPERFEALRCAQV